MRAARLLLEKGEIAPDMTAKVLREIAGAVVAAVLGSLYSKADPLAPLRQFVRALAQVVARDSKLATSMLTRVCYLGPADTVDMIRRLVHEERVEGSDAVIALDTSKETLATALIL